MSILLANTVIRLFGMDLCHLTGRFLTRLGFFYDPALGRPRMSMICAAVSSLPGAEICCTDSLKVGVSLVSIRALEIGLLQQAIIDENVQCQS